MREFEISKKIIEVCPIGNKEFLFKNFEMIDVILGLQWGDEGKGKIVDYFAPHYDAIARFQGGPNAGHSIVVEGKKHILHNIPSGVYHEGKLNIIGNGVVLDPIAFINEAGEVKEAGFNLMDRLFISRRASLILPSHRLVDEALELQKGDAKIGSTKKGIGPAYTDKISRQALRAGDITEHGFEAKYRKLLEVHRKIYESAGLVLNPDTENAWFSAIDNMRNYRLIDSEYLINNLIKEGKNILAEGAQGTMLDVDFGSYPFVTSSNTICGGVCTGLGVAPSSIRKVTGIFKAYCTRVGSGPFPTELFDSTGSFIQQKGMEVGATTGRPRRCGWLDMVALNYAVMINGVTDLVLTKPDVFDEMPTLKIGVAYKTLDGETQILPTDLSSVQEIVYEEFDGWLQPISAMRHENELPEELNAYLDFIENETGVPVEIVSVGPDRVQTIHRGGE